MIFLCTEFIFRAQILEDIEASIASKIGRKQIILNEIIKSTRPGFVRIAPKIGASARDKFLAGNIANIDIHIQDKVRYFLHGAGDREICAYFLRERSIAAAASLQVRSMRSGFDRTDIDDLKLARLGKGLAQLSLNFFSRSFSSGRVP